MNNQCFRRSIKAVLRKPGKDYYFIIKSNWLIALLKKLGKALALLYLNNHHNLLPQTQSEGRKWRSQNTLSTLYLNKPIRHRIINRLLVIAMWSLLQHISSHLRLLRNLWKRKVDTIIHSLHARPHVKYDVQIRLPLYHINIPNP